MQEVPGFYIDRNDRPALAGPDGLLLPVCDVENGVQGFQIRPDDPNIGKRIWLSSAGRRGGTGSGAPAHWSFPRHVRDVFTAYVVEGVLSADICSDILGALCIGLAGKTNWHVLEPEHLSLVSIERVVIALDQDDPDGGVHEEAYPLVEFLSNDLTVNIARWNGTRAKGFDDCLLLKRGFKFA